MLKGQEEQAEPTAPYMSSDWLTDLWNHHPSDWDLFRDKTLDMLRSVQVTLLELTSPLWIILCTELWLRDVV